ncbi:MAG: tetratricopeptide repeat protein, partial [Planctomycetes bacterium]|nr:tetratricopeptide repeat protein [Planctomycetota bacterium]
AEKPKPNLMVMEQSEPVVAPPPPPPDSEIGQLILRAEDAFDQGEYNTAIELFNQALEINYNCVEALSGRGRAQAKAGLNEEALVSMKEAVGLNPNDADNFYVLGFIQRTLGKDVEAAYTYGKFLALAPDAENSDKIREWIETVRASHPQQEEEDDGKLKIDRQPVWAAALEEPPEEYQDIGQLDIVNPDAESQDAEQEADVQVEPEAAPVEAPAPVEPPAPEPAAPAFSVQHVEETPEEDEQEKIDNQLDRIRMILSQGDSVSALSMAQEFVGLHPDLTDAKILIARCFGQQGEFSKALAILKNIIDHEQSDEAYFFMGRCQQELGKNRDARETFLECHEITQNPQLKQRINEILADMDARDKSLCSSCGAKVPVQDLKEYSGQQLCPECRAKIESSMGGAASLATADDQAAQLMQQQERKRKMLEAKARQTKKSGLLMPLIIMMLLFVLLVGGVGALLYYKSPFTYESIREAAPPWLPLPPSMIADKPKHKPGGAPDGGHAGGFGNIGTKPGTVEKGTQEQTPVKVRQILIDSQPLGKLVAGVEYIHTLNASGAEKDEVTYGVKFSRKVKNAYAFDPKTGTLLWKPDVSDVGAPLTITFTASVEGGTAPEQPCEVTVRPPASVVPLGPKAPVFPGEAVCLATGDLSGDGVDDILVSHGDYWQSELVLYISHEGVLREASRLKFNGRAIGMGIGNYGEGSRRALIVDYWNSKIFFVGFEGGSLVRFPDEISLPARPTLAAFGNPDGEGPEGAAVYMPSINMVHVFDAVGGVKLGLFRKTPAPKDVPWKQLLMANLYRETEDDTWSELVLLRLGVNQPNLFTISLKSEKEWSSLNIGTGVNQTAIAGDFAGEVEDSLEDVAVVVGSRESIVHILPGQKKGQNNLDASIETAGTGPVIALGMADIDGNGFKDLALFFHDKVFFRLRKADGKGLPLAQARSGELVVPPLGPTAVGDFNGDKAKDVLFIDREGRLLMLSIPSK